MTNCPNCAAPIRPGDTRCEYCGTWYVGADLAQSQDVVVIRKLYANGEVVLTITTEIDRALSDPDYTQKGGL